MARFNDPVWDEPQNALGRRHKEYEMGDIRAFGCVTIGAKGAVTADFMLEDATPDEFLRLAAGLKKLEIEMKRRAGIILPA